MDREDKQSLRISRRGLLVGAPAVLATSLALGQGPASESASKLLLERNAVRIAVPRFSSPPFFDGDANLQGLDAELSREIAAGLGVEAIFDRSPSTFDEAVALVAQGGADLAICKLSRTLRRGRVIRYSRPYAELHHGLITNRVRFARLAGRRETEEVVRAFGGVLGVIANSSFAGFARTRFPNAQLQTFDHWSEVVDAIRNEEIDAAYRDDFEIKRVFVDDPSLTVSARSITLTDQTDTLAVGVRPDAGHLLDFVNLCFDLSPVRRPLSADDILAKFVDRVGA